MYNIEVASDVFEGKGLLEQHRMVNEVRAQFSCAFTTSLTPFITIPTVTEE